MLPLLVSTVLYCSVIKVYDGDTVKLACPQEQKVRLCGIDAPETKQPLGKESKVLLANLLSSNRAELSPIGYDKYDRVIGEIKVGGESINRTMVKAGLAYHYSEFSGNCSNRKELISAEREAKAKKRGIWGGDYEKPWEYRSRTTKKSRQKRKIMTK